MRHFRTFACLLLGGALLAHSALATASPTTSPLIEAVRDDVAADVARVLRSRPDVNARDQLGATALAWSVVRSNTEVVRDLLAAGADPNLADVSGVTPLAIAVENNSAGIVRLLLDAHADPNLARGAGETPLMTAAAMGSGDVVRLLLDHGADPNAREEKFGQTPLMWAAGHPDIVRLLLAKGADIRATSKSWEVTATLYTPITGTLGVTGIPWNHSGDYTTKAGGLTPLLFAVQKDDLESAKLLLQAGADVNSPAADGSTPLLVSLFKWSLNGRQTKLGNAAVLGSPDLAYDADIAMANMLLDAGAKVDVANGTGHTPLHGAILGLVLSGREGQSSLAYSSNPSFGAGKRPAPPANEAPTLALVERLLAAGADPNRRTLYPAQGPVNAVRVDPIPPGSSAFHVAAGSHSARLVALLARHGADPNLVRSDGHTPFSVAVMSNDLPVVQEMAAGGADIAQLYDPIDEIPDPVESKTQRRKRQTILHIAAAAGSDWVVDFLVKKGAPPNARNSLGETAHDLADAQERYRYARVLEGSRGRAQRHLEPRDTHTTAALARATGLTPRGKASPPVETAQVTPRS